jgi:hypothetical protein
LPRQIAKRYDFAHDVRSAYAGICENCHVVEIAIDHGKIETNVKTAKFIAAEQRLLCKSFGEFDEDAPVGRIPDFPEGDNEPQPFDDVQINLIVPKQLH